jgi:acylphosphatase
MNDAAIESWLARVRGRVQGVGFREACVEQAEALGITGWVRNRKDGSVEALLQGHPPQLARMRDWLRHGPPLAAVRELSVTPAPDDVPRFGRFERRRSE